MTIDVRIPRVPGTYALLVHLAQDSQINVGVLGKHRFPAGGYLYVGSAQGPGGLHARVQRHLRREKQRRPHWHIDWLLSIGSISEVWWYSSLTSIECAWAGTIAEVGTRFPPKFGSSDCHCPGHLIYMGDHRGLNAAWECSNVLTRGEIIRIKMGEG